MRILFLFLLILLKILAEFQETTVKFSISEDAPINTLVGTIPLESDLSYRLSGSSKPFNVDVKTGEITVVQPIDREQTNSSVKFLLISSFPSILHILIDIQDVNDNDPSFPLQFQNLSIVETAAIGTRLTLLTASDPDAGSNGTIVNYLLTPEDVFKLVQEDGNLFMELQKTLDRETKDIYVYTLTAVDGGQPPRNSSMTVYVEVLDVNDNAPQFDSKQRTVNWNGQLSTQITKIVVSDEDSGANGQISLSILPPESKYFSINNENHLLSKENNPTCCQQPPCATCLLTVKATDTGSPPLENTQILLINITTENLHDPEIHVRLHPSHVNFALLDHEAVAGRTVAVLTVTDEDAPIDASALVIATGNDENAFKLVPQKQFSLLKLLTDVSNLLKDKYTLTFKASDGERTTTKHLEIYVNNISSHVDVNKTMEVSIDEDAPIGSFVALLKPNVSGCSFFVNNTDYFTVDSVSGVVTTLRHLDASMTSSYHIEVYTLPPPPSINTLTTLIDISIDDVNNHFPQFIDLPHLIRIPEDMTPGSTVWNVTVNDDDKGNNGDVIVRIVNEASEYFGMVHNKLVLKKSIDYEVNNEFVVELEAVDDGHLPLTSRQTLRIVVTDVNDHPPHFPCSIHYVTIHPNTPTGSDVMTVKAIDEDSPGPNSDVTYFIIDMTSSFSIHPTSGLIKTQTSLDQTTYTFDVYAMDAGGMMSSNNVTVHVHVTSRVMTSSLPDEIVLGPRKIVKLTENDDVIVKLDSEDFEMDDNKWLIQIKSTSMTSLNILLTADDVTISHCFRLTSPPMTTPPHFSHTSMDILMTSHDVIGQQVAKLTACQQQQCHYSTNCPFFTISTSGLIRMTSPFPSDHLICDVTASDDVTNATIKLNIRKQQQQQPPADDHLLLKANYYFNLPEVTSLGSVFGRLPTSKQHVYSSMTSSAPVGIFPDGVLYVRRPLDDVIDRRIQMQVQAKNMMTSSRYETLVTVVVDDLNNHAPECPVNNVYRIEENAPVMTTIGYLNATDKDYGRNGIVTYRLVDYRNPLIHVGEVTGKMSTLTSFDYEQQQQLNVTIEISDSGIVKKSIKCDVIIQIIDQNDNFPTFSQQFYRRHVDVDDNNIVTVKATDMDSGDNAKLRYDITNFRHLFKMNATTGQLTLLKRMTSSSEYNITVKVTDSGFLPLSSETFILVTTLPATGLINIDRNKTLIRLSPSSTVGSIVGRIHMTSSDVTTFSSLSPLISIDSLGHIIQTSEDLHLHQSVDVTLTSSTSTSTLTIPITSTSTPSDAIYHVPENTFPLIITNFSSDDVTILFTSPTCDDVIISNASLYLIRPLDREKTSKYTIVVRHDDVISLIRITVDDIDDNPPYCLQSTFLIDNASTVLQPDCQDDDITSDDVIITSPNNNYVHVEADNQLRLVTSPDDVITTVMLQLTEHGHSQPLPVTLLTDVPDDDVIFPSRHFQLLLSSSVTIGESFGRITAEAPLPVQYFVVGSSSIDIDRYSGELKVVRKVTSDQNMTIIAASVRGVSKASIHVELVEDILQLQQDAFVFMVDDVRRLHDVIGKLDVGRDDVIFVVNSNNNNNSVDVVVNNLMFKTPMTSDYLEVEIEARKGRLSAMVKVLLIRRSKPQDDDVMWIRENAPRGSIVAKVPPGSTVTNDAPLIIDQDGYVKTTRVLDREEKSIYDVIIDGVTRTLIIDDENDNPPEVKDNNISINIPRDCEIGSILYKLEWIDKDINNNFHLSITEGNEFNLFSIDDLGHMKTQESLTWHPANSHNLTIKLQDGHAPFPYHSLLIHVTVNIDDVIIRPPKMTSLPVFYVEENTPRGHVIGAVTSDDVIAYRILPETLPYAQFLIDPVFGYLTVNDVIDYEKVTNFSMAIELYDVMRPEVTSHEWISIEIIDRNDNFPYFLEDKVEIDVNETIPINTEMYGFLAHDDDGSSDMRSVLYSLEDHFGVFGIRPLTGILYNRRRLDYEEKKEYRLVVMARNVVGGPPAKIDVIVRIHDENDEKPRFVQGCPVHFEIYENVEAPVIIGSTVADDDDEGDNGLLAYSLLKGNTSLFNVNSSSGVISVLANLDREQQDEYRLTVRVTDAGVPQRLSETCDVIIKVLDDNDNAPEFEQPYYKAQILENTTKAHDVLTVRAVDQDAGDNGKIRYRLLNYSTPFVVDPISGVVTVVGELMPKIYRLIVQATDSGQYTQQQTSVEVEIDVKDVNNHSPVIGNSQLDVYIRNDLKKDDVVYVVDGSDEDLGEIYFNISGPDASYFRIDGQGVIRLNTETINMKTFYSLLITVSDEDGLNTSSSFSFYLDDPSLFPTMTSSPPKISINEGLATDVFKFEASDATTVIYSILSGNKDHIFHMDPITGVLSATGDSDHEKTPAYHLWLMATVNTQPPRSCLQVVDVNIDDVNDNKPQFRDVIYRVEVMENDDVISELIDMKASDADESINADIDYDIIDGNEEKYFAIDKKTGVISVMTSLDREYKSQYRLIVQAMDNGSPRLASTAVVVVYVLDEDDNSPRFTRIFHADVAEDAEIGSEVIQVSATDVDGHMNHTFALENFEDVFYVEMFTGIIRLKSALDREKKSSYRLKIRADDGSWTIRTHVTITVTDINDNAPIFTSRDYIFIIDDTSRDDTRVHAEDLDNGHVFYSIPHDNGHVTIDTVTGSLRLVNPMTSPLLIFDVIASDDGIPAMTSSATVIFVSRHLATMRQQKNISIDSTMDVGDVITRVDGTFDVVVGHDVYLHDDVITLVNNNSHGEMIHLVDTVNGVYQPLLMTSHDVITPDVNSTEITILESTTPGTTVYQFPAGPQFYTSSTPEVFRVTLDGDVILMTSLDYLIMTSYDVNVTATVANKSKWIILKISLLRENLRRPYFVRNLEPYVIMTPYDVICYDVIDDDSDVNDLSSDDVTMINATCFNVNNNNNNIVMTSSDGQLSTTTTLKVLTYYPSPLATPPRSTVDVPVDVNNVLLMTCDDVMVTNDDVIRKQQQQKLVYLNKAISEDKQVDFIRLTRFGRELERFKLDLHVVDVAPPPSFPEVVYRFDVMTSQKIVYDFHMDMTMDAHVEIRQDHETFCMSNSSLLTICGPIAKRINNLQLKVIWRNATYSTSDVIVTIHHAKINTVYGHLRENSRVGTNILKIPSIGLKNPEFLIKDDAMRKVFAVSKEGVLSSMTSLDREKRSVYTIPLSIRTAKDTVDLTARVFVDDVIDEDVREDNDVIMHSVNSLNSWKSHVAPADDDLDKPFKCLPIRHDSFELDLKCDLTVFSTPLEEKIPIMAKWNGSWINYTLTSQPFNFPSEENYLDSAVKLQFLALQDGVADVISMISQEFPDLTIIPLAIYSNQPSVNNMIIIIRDRKDNLLPSTEAMAVVKRFLYKTTTTSYDVIDVSIDFCRDSPCSTECSSSIDFTGKSLSFRNSDQVWNILEGNLKTSCKPSCASPCTSGCDTHGKCLLTCPQICQNGFCLGWKCMCSPGFQGPNCSEQAYKPPQNPTNPCDAHECHGGLCVLDHNQPSCQCEEGFLARDCRTADDVISLSSGYLEMKPSEQLFLEDPDLCNGTRSFSFHFKTTATRVTVAEFHLGMLTAVVEIESSRIQYRITDGYRNPIQLNLLEKVSDGEWHMAELILSQDLKMIRFQLDGTGKEAKSHIPLPDFLSRKLEKIVIGSTSEYLRSNLCIKQLVVNNRLQDVNNNNSNKQFFTSKFVGQTSSCSSILPAASPSTWTPSLLAASVSLVAIALLLLLSLLCYKLYTSYGLRRKGETTSSWKRANDFNAMVTPSKGHLNRAMVPSISSTDSLEQQQHYTMATYQRAQTISIDDVIVNRPPRQTVADVKLHITRSSNRSAYNNEAYF